MISLCSCAVVALVAAGSSVLADDAIPRTDAPDLAAVRDKIDAADYGGAVVDLTAMVDRGVQNAEVYSLIEFSLRRSGDIKGAQTAHRKGLEFDPDRKDTLESSEALFVPLGDVTRAWRNAARRLPLCRGGCEEVARPPAIDREPGPGH